GNGVLSCSILTTAPNELAGTVHDRMPLILPPDAYERWLGEKPAGNLAELLAPYPARDMRAYRVGKLVGNPRNDVPECIRPID
ncbi:MAG TPA: SOS response-associated peptidase family protein, partial [Candidatus Cybelea sp.]|nr:SOS response-associated peptidase family protein [Candidatus Cybelea sp.]